MEENKGHTEPGFSGYLKYRKNSLSGKEKNAYEKSLQKDPFALEAEEGLSELSPGELSDDLASLSGRLKSRTGKGSRRIIYRVAASAALLLSLSVIYFLLNRTPGKVETTVPGKIAGLTENKALEENLKRETQSPAGKSMGSRKPETHESLHDAGTQGGNAVQRKEAQKQPEIPEEKADLAVQKDLSRSIVAINESRNVTGTITSADDNSPVAGVNVLVKGTKTGAVTDKNGTYKLTLPGKKDATLVASFAGMENKETRVGNDSVVNMALQGSVAGLDEVVVIGYGVSKNESEVAPADYTSPEPVEGKKKFDEYISENIRKPAGLMQGEKAVVIVKFTVRLNGKPDSIRILRSPGEDYSGEAIRLIKEGPPWKPATNGGEPVEEEIRVRIVFR
ncbi:MAG TPA: carboxypeptidase-like regulatory domain-containing protein [Bacteroidales bacterium]|nr:carboxypeptidase-like regulatory domain-containing protein [Bacteroidales bacterium]